MQHASSHRRHAADTHAASRSRHTAAWRATYVRAHAYTHMLQRTNVNQHNSCADAAARTTRAQMQQHVRVRIDLPRCMRCTGLPCVVARRRRRCRRTGGKDRQPRRRAALATARLTASVLCARMLVLHGSPRVAPLQLNFRRNPSSAPTAASWRCTATAGTAPSRAGRLLCLRTDS